MAELLGTSLFNDANLQEYYTLEDANADKNSNNLTNNNTVTFTAAKYSNGANLGASNTNKSLSIASSLGYGGGAYSISVWVKLLAEIGADTWAFVGVGDSTTDTILRIQYQYNGGTRRLRFLRAQYGLAAANVYYEITLGTTNWHHLVIAYDGSNFHAYVDNVDVGNANASGNGTAAYPANAFVIGANDDDIAASLASALFDDVGLFNDQLTSTEVETLYLSGTNYTKEFNETITVSDTLVKALTKTWNETVTLTETISKILGHFLSLTDYMSVSENELDDYKEDNKNTYVGIGDSGTVNFIGQAFNNPVATKLSACKFYLEKFSAPSGNITALIYAITGSLGTTAKPTGAALATSDVIDVSTLPASFDLVTFTFSGVNKINLAAGTNYGIVLNYDGVNAALVGIDNSSPSHNGNYFASVDGSTWTPSSTIDVCFYIYGEYGIQKAITRTLSETVTVTDTIIKAITRILSETAITITDTIVKAISKTLSETLTISDTIIKAITKIFTESAITLTDTFTRAFTKTLSETINLTDTIGMVLNKISSGIPNLVNDAIRRIFQDKGTGSTRTDKGIGNSRNKDKPEMR